MSGLSLPAHRIQNAALGGYGHDGWHVDLRLQSENALLRLRVRNFRDNTVLEVSNVWRVQFVPTLEDNNRFHLRLFQNYENWEREAIVSDDTNFFLQANRLLSTSARLLVFDERHVSTSIPSWIINVGWRLLRYTDGNSFFWQAKQEPDPFEPQPEPPAEQDYDISKLLAEVPDADQVTDADKINGWVCAICHNGIAENRQLVAAHLQPTENGTLHVFHRECLEQWHRREATCPTCRVRLETKPLPAVWSAGNTRLNAHMAVSYIRPWYMVR
jgi:hypothetical protein